MKILSFLFAFISLVFGSLQAQVQLTNHNEMLGERNLHSAVPVAVADMNGDGLDDIVSLDQGKILYIQYQSPDAGRPFVRYKLPVTLDQNEQNDICIADFNNDGANDIFAVGSYDRIKVFYNVPHTYEFNLQYLDVTPFFSQGASTGDFNHDGWVDVVMLNDNAANYTFLNDGTGNLVEQTLFDFVTVPASDNSGNYGSVYTDFDMDGDLDFYIAKCRQGVNDPADPRRIDALFVNDGHGNYTQDAARYGLADGHQTWTADFGDFDNDGDLDLFKTQHDVISELFENIGNDTFINITPTTGLNIGGVPLQGMFSDLDNDGYLDILVSGDHVEFYHNNGDKTFTKQDLFGAVVFGTFALGDLNQDGFTDVYASRVVPFNNPDLLREDILYLNDKNTNHFLSLSLTDTQGNASAIGAMALLYGPWGTQVREVRGGEQYGVSNSHKLIFGLGNYTTYDSLVIRWPDGMRESFNSLEADNIYSLRRGGCNSTSPILGNTFEVLCNSDSLVIRSTFGSNLIAWSNGSQADSIVVKEKGLYYAVYSDANNCPVHTQPIEVTINPDMQKPTIFYPGNPQLCNGEIAVLSLPSAESYLWSSGEQTQTIEATQTGDYFAAVQGYCENQPSDTIHLDFLVPDVPVTTQDTFFPGEAASLYASGDSIQWFSDISGINPIGFGNTLILDNLTDTTTVYAQNVKPIVGQDFEVGPVTQAGTTKYNAAFVNGGLLFEVYEPIVLNQITVFTDSVGTRIIEITNGNDFFYEHQVDLTAGMTVLDLNVDIPAGAYTIGTNTDLNNLVFGANSPYLWRSSAGILYPYEVPGIFSITSSTFGGDFFYYFYDWKISTADKYCGSELVPATAVIDLGTATEEDHSLEGQVMVSPNPTDGRVILSSKSEAPMHIEINAVDGSKLDESQVLSSGEGSRAIDLSMYPAGIYFIRIIQDGKTLIKRIIRS